MRRRIAAVASTLLFAAVLSAQGAPPEKKKSDANRVDVLVTGCLHGEMLVETRPAGDENSWKNVGQTYRLKAARAVMRAIKEHSGRIAEITGTVDSRQLDTATTGGVRVGKRARVFIGKREEVNLNPPPFSPTLDVKSFKATAEKCR